MGSNAWKRSHGLTSGSYVIGAREDGRVVVDVDALWTDTDCVVTTDGEEERVYTHTVLMTADGRLERVMVSAAHTRECVADLSADQLRAIAAEAERVFVARFGAARRAA